MPIIINKTDAKAVIRVTGATTETFTLANFGANTTSVNITKVLWSNTTTIARGANTLLSLTGSGSWDLAGLGINLSEFNTANVVITTVAGGSAIVEVSKLPNRAE